MALPRLTSAILGEGLWDELREHGVDVTAFMIGLDLHPQFSTLPESEPISFRQ